MPYMRQSGTAFVLCSEHQPRAFEVSERTATDWTAICGASIGAPRNTYGYRVRPYPAMDVASHLPYAPDGIYTDHRDPTVQHDAYAMRDRLLRESTGDRQAMLQSIADTFGLRHWRDAYNATRNEGRRHTGENGRNADGELVWRRWSTGAWSQTAIARVATATTRAFGVELEFNHPHGGTSGDGAACHAICAQARRQGMAFSEYWTSYGSTDHNGRRRAAGWLGTYDSTVSGGEIISDILAGDNASMDEVRDMLAIIRTHGGQAGQRQGVHVHHDARDFDQADKVRLVDNLRVLAPLLDAYLPASRRNGYWCGHMDDYAWDSERRSVAAGCGGSGSHSYAYNFGHLYERSARVEFRAFGHSLNSTKLRCWIRVGQAIMTATKAGTTFLPGTTTESMLAALRTTGRLSEAAADRFAATVARRTRRPALAY